MLLKYFVMLILIVDFFDDSQALEPSDEGACVVKIR